MDETVFKKIVHRNDTSSNWSAVGDTVILLQGEMGVEFPDEGGEPKLKMGDGVTAWNELPYLKTENNNDETSDLQEKVTLLEETVGGGDIRIQNTESGVTAAVTTADTAMTEMGVLREEVAGQMAAQNTSIEEINAKVTENEAAVAEMNLTVEAIQDRQDTQEMEIQVANDRVDNLIAGFSDNAEFDNAELLDIRTGYDGTRYATAGDAVRQIGYDMTELSQNLEGALGKDIPDGLSYEGNKLYLTSNGEMVGEPVTVVGGSGGGSSNQTYTITLMNLLDSRVMTLTADDECRLEFSYQSVDDDGFDDGSGIGYIYVNNSQITTLSVAQGNNVFDVTPYLASGENSIRIQAENSEGSKKTLTYTVTVLVLAVTTTAPKMGLYTGQQSILYTVTGAGTKTVHFLYGRPRDRNGYGGDFRRIPCHLHP